MSKRLIPIIIPIISLILILIIHPLIFSQGQENAESIEGYAINVGAWYRDKCDGGITRTYNYPTETLVKTECGTSQKIYYMTFYFDLCPGEEIVGYKYSDNRGIICSEEGLTEVVVDSTIVKDYDLYHKVDKDFFDIAGDESYVIYYKHNRTLTNLNQYIQFPDDQWPLSSSTTKPANYTTENDNNSVTSANGNDLVVLLLSLILLSRLRRK